MKFHRQVYYYKGYFKDFYNKQDPAVRKKIDWIIGLVQELEIIPSKFFSHIEGTEGIFEIRVMIRRNIFRIFCFFDEDQLIILLHGFQKKTQKTPKNEITKAIRLREEYYEQKK